MSREKGISMQDEACRMYIKAWLSVQDLHHDMFPLFLLFPWSSGSGMYRHAGMETVKLGYGWWHRSHGVRHMDGSIRPTPRPVSMVPSRDVSVEPSSRFGPDREALQVVLHAEHRTCGDTVAQLYRTATWIIFMLTYWCSRAQSYRTAAWIVFTLTYWCSGAPALLCAAV